MDLATWIDSAYFALDFTDKVLTSTDMHSRLSSL